MDKAPRREMPIRPNERRGGYTGKPMPPGAKPPPGPAADVPIKKPSSGK